MMNFVSNEEDQDEDNKKEVIKENSKLPFSFSFSSSSSSSVSSTSKYNPFVPHHHQSSWPLGPFDSQQVNFDNKVELMDLSLGNNNNNQEPSSGNVTSIEKEHMFDKVVTPSDVGKLNRLVIPKQHAERYFPLDSSSNEKGLLLNFEDRNGKAWKFRYSYWNSSQSYVMTKGWSRFVKDKKLEAGDTVSFHRGVGDLGKDRLYIDWRSRPDNNFPDPTLLAAQMQLQNQQSVWWGTRLYSFPQSMSSISPYFQQRRQQQQQQQQILGYYLRPSGSQQIAERGHMPMVIDSVPVIPGKSTAAKRLRLFGVNMECSTQDDDDDDQSPATSAPILAATRQAAHEYSNKGKSSLSFDLDL